MNEAVSTALCTALYRADILTHEQRSLLIVMLDRWPKTLQDAERYRWLKAACRDEQENTAEPQLIHLHSSTRLPSGVDWQQYLDASIDAQIALLKK